MSTASTEITIAAPLHEVFRFASDWRHWEEWFVGVSRFRVVSERSRGTGARYAYRSRIMGLPLPVETEIRDFVEDEGWRGVAPRGPKHETRWRFEACDGGTRFAFAMDYELPLLPAFLDRRFVLPYWQRWLEASARNLKARCESGRPPEGEATKG